MVEHPLPVTRLLRIWLVSSSMYSIGPLPNAPTMELYASHDSGRLTTKHRIAATMHFSTSVRFAGEPTSIDIAVRTASPGSTPFSTA